MKKIFPCIIALLACASFSCAPLKTNSSREEDVLRAPFQSVAIGLCEDYPEETRLLWLARRDLEVLKTNNVHVLRVAFGWDAMQPSPGKFDWSFWDDFVRIATDEYGIRLIPYVCYTPRWISTSTNADFWQQPPTNTAPFAEFMKQIVARYKDRIHSWEIWNEPDNSYYWRGTTEQFVELLVAGARAVHEADSRATVVMGGLAWNLNFLEAVLSNPVALQNVDVFNLHNYYETWSSDPLEKIPDYIGRAHDLIRERGGRQPIWLAEVGYSSFRRGAHVSDQYTAQFRNEHLPEAQAANLFRALTLASASGNVSLIAWYRVNDLPAAQEVIGDANNRHLGVLDEYGKPKPALHALRFFSSLFSERFRCLDPDVRICREIGSPAEVHVFETPDAFVIVAWTKTYVPGTRLAPLDGKTPDRREANVTVQIPSAAIGFAKRFDELGRARGIVSSKPRDGKNIFDLHLRAGHVEVLTIRRSE